ncbi:MAG TPA: ABC-2 family transporter protein [Deinococcales bacterium]|nr:ABC-2 family transporter protein [Deinococcales bacterium]
MSGTLRRHLRLAGLFASASIAARMEYRTNFLLNTLTALLEVGGAILGLVVLFADGQRLGGWTQREALVVVGVYNLVNGAISTYIRPNLGRIASLVRDGALDFRLLKPVDTQFIVSVRDFNLFAVPGMLLGLAVIVWAAWDLPGVTLAGAAFGALMVVAGLAIVYSLWFMLSTTAFWFVKVENASELFNGFFQAGQFPVTAFPGWARVMFTFIIPIAFITTVPAELVVGRAGPERALLAAGVAVALIVISRLFWQHAIRSYTSASS